MKTLREKLPKLLIVIVICGLLVILIRFPRTAFAILVDGFLILKLFESRNSRCDLGVHPPLAAPGIVWVLCLVRSKWVVRCVLCYEILVFPASLDYDYTETTKERARIEAHESLRDYSSPKHDGMYYAERQVHENQKRFLESPLHSFIKVAEFHLLAWAAPLLLFLVALLMSWLCDLWHALRMS